jgi:hypothetical protein
MAVKTIKPQNKTRAEGKGSSGNIIPELTNLQAFNLVTMLENPGCTHVDKIFITEAGYFFSDGNDLHELVDLDPNVPQEAFLLKQGKKQKKVLLPGKYISRKPVLKEYAREEILDKEVEILTAFKEEQRALKESRKAEAGEEGSPVQVITEALKKLSETKK